VPDIALAIYLAFFAVAFGWRMWLQYRRTGDTGFRGFSSGTGLIDILGSLSLMLAATLPAAAAIAARFNLAAPFDGVNTVAANRAGLALASLGFIIVIVAQLQMRDSWRVGVDGRETTALVTTGLFEMMRNPIYTGSFLAIAGVFLMVPNLLSAVALALSVPGLEIQVRRVEEPYLLRVHGDRYRGYARHVGRFIPWVGRLS
jgi:protein-S-isoprenylcysteine O-methyltransferase Ste14